MRIALLAPLLASLVASASAQTDPATMQAAAQDLQSQRSECWKRVDQKVYRTIVEVTTCENAAWRSYMTTINFPWMDLEEASEAAKLEHARMADARRISVAREMQEDAETDTWFQGEVNKRVEASVAAAQDDTEQRRREAQLCYAAGLLAPGMAPGAALGYAQHAYLSCLQGRGMPPSPARRSFDTTCSTDAAGFTHCTTE